MDVGFSLNEGEFESISSLSAKIGTLFGFSRGCVHIRFELRTISFRILREIFLISAQSSETNWCF